MVVLRANWCGAMRPQYAKLPWDWMLPGYDRGCGPVYVKSRQTASHSIFHCRGLASTNRGGNLAGGQPTWGSSHCCLQYKDAGP